jgi:hypothetical protein
MAHFGTDRADRYRCKSISAIPRRRVTEAAPDYSNQPVTSSTKSVVPLGLSGIPQKTVI